MRDGLLLGALVLAGFLVETTAGFGSMVLIVTVGSLWFPLDALLGWMVPLNLVLSTWLVARGWRAVSWRLLLGRMVPLLGVGMLGGVLLAGALQAAALQVVLGALVVAVAAWQLLELRRAQGASALSTPVRTLALLGAGVVHGMFATGGPLAVFVAARELPGKQAFRATLSALWVLLNAALVAQLASRGVVSARTLPMTAWMLAPLALGIVAGEWAHGAVDERRFRLGVAVLLLVAGGVSTVSALAGGAR